MYTAKRGNRYLLFSLFSFIIGSLFLSFYMEYTGKDLSLSSTLIFSQWVIIFVPIVLYFIITKSPIKETLLFYRLSPLSAIICVAIALFISPLLSLINLLSQFFVKNQISDTVMDIANLPLLVALFFIAVTPAFLEEIALRGIINSNYRNHPVITTCLINGLFFGIFHMNINQFLYAFVMGAIMCLVVHITGSIFSSMIIHFTINAFSLLMAKFALIAEKLYENNPEMMVQIEDAAVNTTHSLIVASITMLILTVIFFPFACFLIYTLAKKYNKTNIFKLTTAQALDGCQALEPEESYPEEIPTKKDPILTLSFIISVSGFVIFVVLSEFILTV